MGQIKLAVLDSNIFYLGALSEYLSLFDEFEIVGGGICVEELRTSLGMSVPDIILSEYRFFNPNSEIGLKDLFHTHTNMRLLLMDFDLPAQLLTKRKDDARITILSKDIALDALVNRIVYIGSYCGTSSQSEPGW